VDTLNVCIKNVSPTNEEATKGFTSTKKDLEKLFKEFEIVEFQPKIGDEFDMKKHDAVYEAKIEGAKAGTVGGVITSGWIRNDVLLRPAQVGVVPKS